MLTLFFFSRQKRAKNRVKSKEITIFVFFWKWVVGKRYFEVFNPGISLGPGAGPQFGGVEDLLSDFWTLTPRSFAAARCRAVKSSFFKKKRQKNRRKSAFSHFLGFFLRCKRVITCRTRLFSVFFWS